MVKFSDKSLIVVLLLLTVALLSRAASIANNNDNNNNGFMESLSTGFKFATRLLGMDQSSSVANLVAQAFSSPQPSSAPSQTPKNQYQYADSEFSSNDKENFVISSDKSDSQFINTSDKNRIPSTTSTTAASPTSSMTGIASLLRILGMDEKKLSALMVNGLIFLSQLVMKGTSYIDQKISPLKQVFRRLFVRSPINPSSDTITFSKRD